MHTQNEKNGFQSKTMYHTQNFKGFLAARAVKCIYFYFLKKTNLNFYMNDLSFFLNDKTAST